MIDEKDALFIKLQYPDFSKEMVNYAASYIRWDYVPKNNNQFGVMLNFCEKYYTNVDSNVVWTHSIMPKNGTKYPRTK